MDTVRIFWLENVKTMDDSVNTCIVEICRSMGKRFAARILLNDTLSLTIPTLAAQLSDYPFEMVWTRSDANEVEASRQMLYLRDPTSWECKGECKTLQDFVYGEDNLSRFSFVSLDMRTRWGAELYNDQVIRIFECVNKLAIGAFMRVTMHIGQRSPEGLALAIAKKFSACGFVFMYMHNSAFLSCGEYLSFIVYRVQWAYC